MHALRALLATIDAGQVVAVDLAMHPLDAAYPGIDAHGPFATPSGAIMSAPFMLAATLQDGQPGMAHFTAQFGQGPLHARSAMVKVRACESVNRWACRLSLTLADGTVHTGGCEGDFVLDARRTRELCRDVAREWPGGPAGFADLARAVRGQDWPALRAAAYDGPAYDRPVNPSAVLTSPI